MMVPMFVGGSENTSDTKRVASDSPKASDKKNEAKTGADDNDPDIVYGRSFDDEEMAIEKIDGPIGEVTIKGKILTVESAKSETKKRPSLCLRSLISQTPSCSSSLPEMMT